MLQIKKRFRRSAIIGIGKRSELNGTAHRMPQLNFADLTLFDAFAAVFVLIGWYGIGWWVEKRTQRVSASNLMAEHRMAWMHQMMRRDPRILDGNLLNGLQNGSAFFASTSLIGLGGALAILNQAESLGEVAHALPLTSQTSADGFRLRLIATLFFITYAFLKFAWAQRLFSYCSVLIGATPEWDAAREAEITAAADRAGRINILAARSFNRGLRSMYFALASLAWLVGPSALIITSVAVILMINRREFHSDSRNAIIAP